MSFPVRGLVLCAVVPVFLGCHKYVPTTLESVPVGSDVRTVLSTESQEDLRNTLGLDIRELDGKLVEKSDDSVMISVRLATGPQVLGAQPLHQRIAVTRQGVARVDMQKTDPVKTAGLVGIIAGAVTYGIIQLFEPQDPGSPDVDPPPPDEHLRGVLLRVKVFSW